MAVTTKSAKISFKNVTEQKPLVISREELARILGFSVGALKTMINSNITHPILVQDGVADYRAVDERTATPFIEREQVFYMCDEPDGPSRAFWLQLHMKGINDPVMCVLCEPEGADHIKLSHGWMKSILTNENPDYNRELYYRAALGHKNIETFEGLVRRVTGKNLKPNYEPPRSPLYSP